jgi:FkbH-like protein
MKADTRRVDEADLDRVVQLLGKTNQFNLTTRRHGTETVRGWMEDPRAVPLTLRLVDKFGDHGLVAVVLGVPEGDALRIDTWLMSCRVIGRTLEHYTLAQVAEAARAAGYTRLVGEYLPTAKNEQVADLYERLGFEPVATGEDGRKVYVAEVERVAGVETFVG